MKRYLLFGGKSIPEGGWLDFIDSFDNPSDALNSLPENNVWYHVVDSETGEIVAYG